MKIKLSIIAAIGFFYGLALADTINGIDIDFVSIGDPGNAAETVTTNGYGAVGYTYQIGQYEITADQFIASGVGAAAGTGDLPATQVTWNEAALFCNWLTTSNVNNGAYFVDGGGIVTGMMSREDILADGGTFYVLPTIDEWYKAAYYKGGDAYSKYAFGLDAPPTAGGQANYNDPTNGAPWTIGSGTSFEQNLTKDMMGNVREWVQSGDSNSVPNQALLGGSFRSGEQSMDIDNEISFVSTSFENDEIGFRVAAIPEPGTISLMSISTISLLLTRRIRRRRRLGASLVPVRQVHACDEFVAVEEQQRLQQVEAHAADSSLEPIMDLVVERIAASWQQAKVRYRQADIAFWNYMVRWYERRQERRKIRRQKLKTKSLKAFDAFLERIMK